MKLFKRADAPPRSLGKDLAILVGTFIFFQVPLVVGMLYHLMFQVTTITCVRDAQGGGDCVIERQVGFTRSTDRVAIADVRAVEVAIEMSGKQRDREAGAIELVLADRRVRLSPDAGIGALLDWRKETARRLDAFVRAKGPATLTTRDMPPTFEANLLASLIQLLQLLAGFLVFAVLFNIVLRKGAGLGFRRG